MVNHKKTVKDPEQQDLKAWDCRVCFGFDSYDLFSGGREEGSKGKGAGKVICRLCLCAGHAGREASSSKSNPEILRWSTTYIKTLCVPDGDKKKALFRLGLPILFVSLPPGRMAPSCHEQEAQEQAAAKPAPAPKAAAQAPWPSGPIEIEDEEEQDPALPWVWRLA